MNMELKRSTYYQNLSEDMKIRYEEKIKKCNSIDPYTINEKDLSRNRNDFPELTLWDIGNHLIYSMSPFTKKMFKAYKSTEGYSFFESGFVIFVGSRKIDNSVIVKGKVKHSQKMNESLLQPWFLAKMDGEILCAHCTCIAGLSETCSHVAALCFAVETITKSLETTSPTDLLCKWNIPKFKEVSQSKSKDIKWTSKSCEPTSSVGNSHSSFSSYYSTMPPLSDEAIYEFINDLHSEGQEAAVRTILYPDEICRVSKIKDDLFLANLYCVDYENKTRSELVEICKSKPLQISKQDLTEITRLTLAKLNSKIWVALRRGRVTGSNFKDCCVANIENPSITLINRLINPVNLFDNIPGIKYQKKNKKKGIREYVHYAELNHGNFNYEESGLIMNPEYPYFTASSDGIVSCDCHGKGCVEIKCLKVLESGESLDMLTNKPYNILKKVDGLFYLQKTHYFYYKTQMQIFLSDANYCDFVIWSPNETLILPVVGDIEFWESAKQRAIEFHSQVMMPELLGKFYTKGRGLNNEQEKYEECLKVVELEIEILGLDKEDYLPQRVIELEIELMGEIEPMGETEPMGEIEPMGVIEPMGEIEAIGFEIEDLKSLPLKEICSTFEYHQEYLSDIYSRLIKEIKNHYYPTDLPSFAAFDLVTEKQFEAMVRVAEAKLVKKVEQYNSSDVIFDAIIAEWAYKVFGEKYNLNRQQAVAAVRQMNFSKPEI